MTLNIRRIVTAHDDDGKAIVGIDAITSNVQRLRSGSFETLIWVTDDTPDTVDGPDPTARAHDIEPPETGSIFRVLELTPGKEAYMHRTDTIDYAICMSGHCEMVLDDGQKVGFNHGDVMVQRGTWHGWANPNEEPCTIAFILIGSKTPSRHIHRDYDRNHG